MFLKKYIILYYVIWILLSNYYLIVHFYYHITHELDNLLKRAADEWIIHRKKKTSGSMMSLISFIYGY